MANDPEQSPGQKPADDYYANLWQSDGWGGPDPNYDEQLRLDAIRDLIEHHVYPGRPLERILDVGCGRGWLTYQLRKYGSVEGLEVVPAAVVIAKRLFPDLVFSVANPVRMTSADVQRFGNADLVVSSEVLEHVPDAEKPAFFQGLALLVKPGGYLILTTPRAEFWKPWLASAPECQPVEEWVTEPGLSKFVESAGFQIVARRRIHLHGHNYHRATGWLLRGRLRPRFLRIIKPLHDAVTHANGFYQVALFRRRIVSTVK